MLIILESTKEVVFEKIIKFLVIEKRNEYVTNQPLSMLMSEWNPYLEYL